MRPTDTMTTQKSEARRRQLLIGFAAVILLSAPGVASVVSGSASSRPLVDDVQVRDQTADRGRDGSAGMRCAECGVVASVVPIEKSGPGIGADGASGAPKKGMKLAAAAFTNGTRVVVRMADGSSHSFIDAGPAKWQPGERVIVINRRNS